MGLSIHHPEPIKEDSVDSRPDIDELFDQMSTRFFKYIDPYVDLSTNENHDVRMTPLTVRKFFSVMSGDTFRLSEYLVRLIASPTPRKGVLLMPGAAGGNLFAARLRTFSLACHGQKLETFYSVVQGKSPASPFSERFQ